jgi:hypothetical protein
VPESTLREEIIFVRCFPSGKCGTQHGLWLRLTGEETVVRTGRQYPVVTSSARVRQARPEAGTQRTLDGVPCLSDWACQLTFLDQRPASAVFDRLSTSFVHYDPAREQVNPPILPRIARWRSR